MLPLSLPEPAGKPPAIPASVAASNEHAGAATGHSAFAAMVDAGKDGPAAGVARAGTPGPAIKQLRTGGDNWLLSRLAALASGAGGGTTPSAAAPSDDAISSASDDDDAEESLDVPHDTTTADIAMLFGDVPALPQPAIRIPIPGDEEADNAEATPAASDAPEASRGRTSLELNELKDAGPRDRAAVAIGFAAKDHSEHAGGVAQTIDLLENVVGSEVNETLGDRSLRTSEKAAPAASVANAGIVPDVEPISESKREVPAAETAANAALDQRTSSNSTRQQTSLPSVRPDVSFARAVGHPPTAHGPMIRSAVASAATSSDKPADAVHAVVEAGLTAALPAQDASANARDTQASRAPSSEIPSRRVDATPSDLPFSTDRDASGSGNHDEDARGRQASAMSARLAAAVASTSESATSHAAGASPVFAIPAIQPTPSQPVTASVEIPSGAAPTLPAENVERLVQTMHVNVKAGVMEATVKLRPEYLGEVTIQLRVDGSNVTAVVQTDAPGVRQWLESQEQTIRNGLAAHGLDLERLIVNPDGERQQQAHDETEANESRRRAYRRRQQSAERFEITV
jgi:flagellar hook-length control protein FliK